MSENTPTTDEVLDAYARWENHDCYYEGDPLLTPDGQLDRRRADRWLAQHDAEVKAQALREAGFRFSDGQWRAYQQIPDQGYSHRHHLERVVDATLRARADEIEKEAGL